MNPLLPEAKNILSYLHGKVVLAIADITTFHGDVIVNAANEEMIGGGGVDGAIHRAAGRRLYEECIKFPRQIGTHIRCSVGEAKMTAAYELPCKRVIHTVGPDYRCPNNQHPVYRICLDEERNLVRVPMSSELLLISCYESSLRLFESLDWATSIAFPSISTGIYGYPLEEAANIAAGVVSAYVERKGGDIYFCFTNKVTMDVYARAFDLRLPSSVPTWTYGTPTTKGETSERETTTD